MKGLRYLGICGLFAVVGGTFLVSKVTYAAEPMAKGAMASDPNKSGADKSGVDKSGADKSGVDRARKLFRLGLNAFKVGRVEEARQLIGEAWELQQSYDIAGALGQVEAELGHFVQAYELLEFTVQNFPPIESDDKLSKMRQMRDLMRLKVTELDVNTSSNDVELKVDNDVLVPLPLVKPLFVLPGDHTLTLVRRGEPVGPSTTVTAQAGQRTSVELSMTPPPSLVSKPTHREPTRPIAETTEVRAPIWPLYVGGGVVALNLAAAIGFKAAANGAEDRANSLKNQLSSAQVQCQSAIGTANELNCRKYSDATSESDGYLRLSTYAVGVASTFAVATIAYWVFAQPTASRRTEKAQVSKLTPPTLGVFVDGRSTYLSASGRF
jgi:hypothetical protein